MADKFLSLREELISYGNLPQDWDGYDGKPFSADLINLVGKALDKIIHVLDSN